jgi:hypothetical protein
LRRTTNLWVDLSMPLPTSVFTLVLPKEPDFRGDNGDAWKIAFGKYQWFYVTAAMDMLAKAGATDHSIPKHFARDALRHVPAQWREEYEPDASFSPTQIDRAIKCEKQTFTSAYMSVVALYRACTHGAEFSIDGKKRKYQLRVIPDSLFFSRVRIRPANFCIPGLDQNVAKGVPDDQRSEALIRARQVSHAFWPEIVAGHGATHGSLHPLAKTAPRTLRDDRLDRFVSLGSLGAPASVVSRPCPARLLTLRTF